MEFLAPVILSVVLCMSSVNGFSSGPPSTACADMMPNHGSNSAQPMSTLPYLISASHESYYPGDTITVTISGSAIKGFFLQARTVTDGEHVGSFQTISGTKSVACNGFQAISHSRRLSQSSISVVWTAPNLHVAKDVQIFATVVKDFNNFWVMVPGPVITRTTAKPPPMCNMPVNQFSLGEISRQSYFVSWDTVDANEQIEFTVAAVLGTGVGNHYVSIAFSTDEYMSNDSVVDCIETGSGTVKVQASYNPAWFNTVHPAGDAGLTLVSGSHENGVLRCVFKRAVNRPGDEKFFCLRERPFRLLVASGNVQGDVKQRHSTQATKRPVVSTEEINFMIPGYLKTLK